MPLDLLRRRLVVARLEIFLAIPHPGVGLFALNVMALEMREYMSSDHLIGIEFGFSRGPIVVGDQKTAEA